MPARAPHVPQVGRGTVSAAAMQATQVPRDRRPQVELMQLPEGHEPGTEIRLARLGLVARASTAKPGRPGSRCAGRTAAPAFPGRRRPGLAPPSIRSPPESPAARTRPCSPRPRRAAGQHPVAAAVAEPPDQKNFRSAENNHRAAHIGACGLVHRDSFHARRQGRVGTRSPGAVRHSHPSAKSQPATTSAGQCTPR